MICNRLDELISITFWRKSTIPCGMVLYSLLLLSANFVGDYSLQIFHFSYSAGTLVMQVVFCCVVIFCELIGDRKTALLVGITALINLVVALMAYLLLDFSIPVFWLSQEGVIGHRFNIILMFTLSYVCSALVMIFMAWILRIFFDQRWLLLRIMVILTIGYLIDCAILLPILYYLALDRYMALWKMISLASVKGSLSLIALPVTFFVIYLTRKTTYAK